MTRSGWLAVGLVLAVVRTAPAGDVSRRPVVAPKPGAPAWRPYLPTGSTPDRSAFVRPVRAYASTGREPVAGRDSVWPERRKPALTIRRAGATPEPLPVPEDAVPLPSVQTPADAAVSGLIDRYLPDATAEERSIWLDELRGMPPEIAEDILSAREPLGTAPLLPPQVETPAAAATALTVSSPESATLAVLRQAERLHLHNIANAETPGFKRLRPIFAEAADAGGLAGLTVRRIDLAGEHEPTGRPLDCAISGAGMFVLRNGERVALTRRGTFERSADGTLGLPADGAFWALDPPIGVPAEAVDLAVQADGSVTCRLGKGSETVTLGQVILARVADPSRLKSIGGGLVAAPEGAVESGPPGAASFGTLHAGALERSNVDLDAEQEALRRLRCQIAVFDEATVGHGAGRIADGTR